MNSLVGRVHRGQNREDREGTPFAVFEVHVPALRAPNGRDYGL